MSSFLVGTSPQIRAEPDVDKRVRGSIVRRAAPLTLTIAGTVLCAAGLPTVHPTAEGSTGLISVLGPWYLAGLMLLAAAFVLGLTIGDQPRWLAGVQTILMIVLVGGLGPIVESAPRNAVTYTHLGFAQYIRSTGTLPPPIDARSAWPGMFAALAFVETISGPTSPFAMARWAPLVLDLLWLPGVMVIASSIVADRRALWSSVWVFFIADWTEQTYLSPQALSFFFFLTLTGILLAGFGPDGSARWRARWPKLDSVSSDWKPPTPWSSGLSQPVRMSLLAMVVSFGAAMTVSHQLTPFLTVLVLAGLVVMGRIRTVELPWVIGLLAVGWLSFEAASFWSGHLSLLFGSVGNVGGNVSTAVAGRFQGDSGHQLILICRFGMVIVVVGAAVIGYLRLWSSGRAQRWVPVIAGLPVLTLVVQNYGGEGSIRVYLFALPFLAPLVASAVFPGPAPGSRRQASYSSAGAVDGFVHLPAGPTSRLSERLSARRLLLVGTACVLAGAVTIGGVAATYGGDSYEQVSSSELAAVQWFYEHVPAGATVFTACVNLPWRYEALASYRYKGLPDGHYADLRSDIGPMLSAGAVTYVILSHNQEVCGVDYQGLHPGWLEVLETNLLASRHVTEVYSAGDARVFRVTRARTSPDPTTHGLPSDRSGG